MRSKFSPLAPARGQPADCLWLLATGLVFLVALGLDFGPGLLATARRLWSGPRQDVWQQVQTDQVIRFGVDVNDWPFAAMDGQGGYIGLNVDLGRALAQAMGLQAEFRPAGYDSAYDMLRLGQCDALIGMLENDPARLADFIYTGAYFDAGQVVVLPINKLAPGTDCPGASFILPPARPCLDLSGQRIAVELGSEADAAARWLARRTPGVTLVERDSPELALAAVAAGLADACLADAVWARAAVARQPQFHILPDRVRPYPLALAVQADSPRLRAALARALAQLQTNGTLETILAQWLDR